MPLKREGITKPAVSQIEKERRETAFYMNVIWPEIASPVEHDPIAEPQP